MTVGAVLAAGASTRLGVSKQLLRLPDGEILVRRSARALLAARLTHVAVVVGGVDDAVARSLSGLPLTVLNSPDPTEGMSASVRAAAEWAAGERENSLLLCVCDQPLLSTEHLNALIGAFERDGCVVASHYAGRAGVPALLPASLFPNLLALRGDRGAAELLRHAEPRTLVPWPDGEHDLDTPEDVARLTPR